MLAPGTKRPWPSADTAASATSTRKGPGRVPCFTTQFELQLPRGSKRGAHLMLVNATVPPPGSFEVAASSREKTMKAVTLTIVGLLLSAGLAYAADNPPVQGQPKGHPAVLTDIECNGVWKDAVSGGDMLPEIRPVAIFRTSSKPTQIKTETFHKPSSRRLARRVGSNLSTRNRLRWARMKAATAAMSAKPRQLSSGKIQGQ